MLRSGHTAPVSFPVFIWATVAAAAGPFVCAEEPSRSGGSPTSIEDTRRELKELPAAQRAGSVREKGLDVSVHIPVLAPSTGRGGNQRPSANGFQNNSQGEPSGYSQGWLLDALQTRQLEKSGRGNDLLRSGEQRELELKEAQRKTRESPLNAYLQNWLSPRDRALLTQKDVHANPAEQSVISDLWRQNARSVDLRGGAGDANVRGSQDKPVNPYLDDSSASGSGVFPSPAVTGAGSGARETPLVPVAFPTLAPRKSLDSSLPTAQPNAEDTGALPTTPLVDERRYFPQLKRF